MSREADIVEWVEDAMAIVRRGHTLLEIDDGELERVLVSRLQPEAREFVLNTISHMPLAHRFVHNRMGGKIDTAVAKAIRQAIQKVKQ